MNILALIIVRYCSKHIASLFLFLTIYAIANAAANFLGLMLTANEFALYVAGYITVVFVDIAVYVAMYRNKSKDS